MLGSLSKGMYEVHSCALSAPLTGKLPSPDARMGTLPGRVIADVAVHIGIDDVLPGRIELRECLLELLPVLR